MFQEQEETPELDEKDAKIIEAIDQHLEGITFNKLAIAVAKSMSKVTLANRIKKLKRKGLIMETGDPHHRQKKVYKSTTSMKEIVGVLEQLDTWAQYQTERLSTLEVKLTLGHDVEESDIEIIEGLAEIISEVGLPMVYVLQIRLRYGLKSTMLIVPRAIEAANTILERVIELLDSYPHIGESISRFVTKPGTYATLIERVSKRYLPTFEGKVAC